jgi:glucose/mannose-6-phosphate isomerase
MLDDLNFISKIDKSSMIDTVTRFPEQIKEALEFESYIKLDNFANIDTIIISGMGGSAISGDIIQTYLKDKLDIPIYINRSYNLPRWANNKTLTLVQSYSGNTEETLSSFKDAKIKKCKIICISSGGKLQEYCKKQDTCHFKIPSGYAPRAATAYPLILSFLIFEKIGIVKNSISLEIKESVIAAEEVRNNNNKTVNEKDNISKQIARKIFNTIPQLYGWGIYEPIAKRWCNQINENSKKIARYDNVSECNHNDIVGWSQDPIMSKKFTCLLFRDKGIESDQISKRLNFMKNLFEDVASNVIEIKINCRKRLAKMIYSMYIGDYVSCYLAILRGIDPTPVEIINKLKKELTML